VGEHEETIGPDRVDDLARDLVEKFIAGEIER